MNEIKVTYGARLAELRKSADLSPDVIAKRLRIAKSIVMNIELGETQQIPNVFLRGYLIAYAKLVNLPTEELNDYLKQMQISQDERSSIKQYSPTGKKTPYGKYITIVALAGLLILCGIVGFLRWQEYNHSSPAATEFHLSDTPKQTRPVSESDNLLDMTD